MLNNIPLFFNLKKKKPNTAIPTQPGAPEEVSVGKEHIIIQWTKPESDGGSEIKDYLVDKREKKSLRWTRVNRDYNIYDTRLKVTGLMEGGQYQFRVTAVNAAGNSEPSEASQYMLCKEPSCKLPHLKHILISTYNNGA